MISVNIKNLHFNEFHEVDKRIAMLPRFLAITTQRSRVDHLSVFVDSDEASKKAFMFGNEGGDDWQ